MNTALQGFVNGGVTPFVIIDTGNVSASNSDGLLMLDALVGTGTVLLFDTQTNGNTEGNNIFATVPNPWFGNEMAEQTKIASLNDFGVILYINDYNPAIVDLLESNGINPLYGSFPRTYRINNGALSININPNGSSIINNNYIDRWVYDNGISRIRFRWDTHADMYMQFHPNGSVYLFISKAYPKAVVDKISGSSKKLNYVGELELNRIYCIRSSIATAYGTVYNAAGGFAPDCSVMAYNRVTGNLVGKSRSNSQGQYTVQCLASKGDQLFLVWLDDDGVAPEFDAQVIDRIVV